MEYATRVLLLTLIVYVAWVMYHIWWTERHEALKRKVLLILADVRTPLHANLIVEHSKGVLGLNPRLYNCLWRMEDEGLVTSSEMIESLREERGRRPRICYMLTNEGRAEASRLKGGS